MNTSHAKAIRGLGIATVVVAAICIVLMVLVAAGLAFGTAAINDPSLSDSVSFGAVSGSIELDSFSFTDNPVFFLSVLMGAGVVLVVALVVCHIVALVAGVKAIRNSADTAKLGSVFGWSIAGAVTSLIGSNFVTMVLLIIVAVFAYMDRKAASQA